MARATIDPITFNRFAKYEKGRTRRFRFDINALADFEQLTGMGFGQLMSQRAVFASTRALLYAGLKHEDRALTVEDVGDLVFQYLNDDTLESPTVDDLMSEALMAAVEQGALGKEAKAQKQEFDKKKAEADAAAEAKSKNASPAIPADSPATGTGANGSPQPSGSPTDLSN